MYHPCPVTNHKAQRKSHKTGQSNRAHMKIRRTDRIKEHKMKMKTVKSFLQNHKSQKKESWRYRVVVVWQAYGLDTSIN